MRRPSRHFVGVAALVALALAIRFHRIGWGLPGVYEEAVPYWKAWEMWGWGAGRSFDPNPHFFTYPSLTVYLQFLGQGCLFLVWTALGKIHSSLDFRVLYELDKTPFLLVGRSIGALLGAATVLPTYFLAKRAGGSAAAIPAALLVALSPLLIARSQLVEVDVALTFFVTLACLFALRLSEAPTRANCIAAGIAAGLATSSKYTGLLALLPLLAAVVIAARARAGGADARPARKPVQPRQPERARTRKHASADGKRPPSPRGRSRAEALPVPKQIVILLAAFALVLLATSPFVFLDAGAARRELAMAGEHMRLGHFGEAAGRAGISYVRDWVTRLMGPLLGLASLAGLAYFAFWRRPPWASVLAAFVVPFAVFVGSWSRAADNYVMPLIPLGTVFATALVADGARRASDNRPAATRIAAVALATVVFAVPLVAGYAAHLKTLGVDSRARARAWIEANAPSGALIATEMLGPELVTVRDVLGWDQEIRERLSSAGFRPNVYGLEYIAMTALYPEMSARFYDLRLYEPADYIVVTGSVRDRYLADPARFRPQLAFYDSLRRSWPKVHEFPSSGTGCDIVIYKNPGHDQPFASRPPGPIPRLEVNASSELTGEEQALYYTMGINYEGFGFLEHAEAAYRVGMRFPSNRPERYTVMAQRLAGCMVRESRFSEALAALESAAQGAPNPGEAASLRRYRDGLAVRAASGSATPH